MDKKQEIKLGWFAGMLALPFVLVFSAIICLGSFLAVSVGLIVSALCGKMTITFKG